TRVEACRKRAKVVFGLRQGGFRGCAAAGPGASVRGHGYEVVLQGPGVGGRDQALAGAPARDEHGARDAKPAGHREPQRRRAQRGGRGAGGGGGGNLSASRSSMRAWASSLTVLQPLGKRVR